MQTVKKDATAIVFVYLVDATDGYTPELSSTVLAGGTYPTCCLCKNGGTPAALTLSSDNFAALDDTNLPGWYKLSLSSSNTNTVGPLAIDVYRSGVTRHFPCVVYVSAALMDDVKTDTAAILDDTGTTGVVVPTGTINALADQVWDEVLSGHLTTGSTGAKLNAAASAGDPWATDLPGSYSGNDAGYKIARVLSGLGNTLTTLTVEDADDNPLDGVVVDFYTSATPSSGAFYTRALTGTDGQVNVYLPPGTYYAFRFKRGYSFNDPVQVTVT